MQEIYASVHLVICQTIEFYHLAINKVLSGLRQRKRMFSSRRRGTSKTNDAATLTGAVESVCEPQGPK